MASYKVEWKKSAAKELKTLPKAVIREIVDRVTSLAQEPFPFGVKKLAGAEHTYRIRYSSYRVIYTVLRDNLLIEIVRVGHRQAYISLDKVPGRGSMQKGRFLG